MESESASSQGRSQLGEGQQQDGEDADRQRDEETSREGEEQQGDGDEHLDDHSGTHVQWRCQICSISCSMGNHLRSSSDCLLKLKSQPHLQFKGASDDELFILKVCLLHGDCPSNTCLTGKHFDLPLPCLNWWRTVGWQKMGWRGDVEMADSNIIKEKIRNFVKNYTRKRSLEDEVDRGTEASETSQNIDDLLVELEKESVGQCRACGHAGELIRHLDSSSHCRLGYVKMYLPGEEISVRLSLFQLSVVLNVCRRPGCEEEFSYLGPHLNRSDECLEFYRREGMHLALPHWSMTASPSWISRKVAFMRRNLHESKKKERGRGYTSYRSELSRILAHTCCKCGNMGPVVGEANFVMKGGWTGGDGEGSWFCPHCSEESPDFDEVKEKLSSSTEKLKGPRDSQECDVKVVRCAQSGRYTVAPSCLTEDRPGVVLAEPSLSTLVLVPCDDSAIRAVMNWCDEVVKDRSELRECAQELLRKPFLTNFEASFSCLYRLLLANLKSRMRDICRGFSNVARGQIVQKNPNITNARKLIPNTNQTIGLAMQEQCGWSYQCIQQKNKESDARQIVNGRVKIHMRGTILKAFEDEELDRILLEGCKHFVNGNVTTVEALRNDPNIGSFLIKMSPVIVTYLRSKIKLFENHIVAPNFSNYDLKLDIDDQKLQVDIYGVLYAKEFEEVNMMLAAEPDTSLLPDIATRIAGEESTFPTATLNWANLMGSYNIDELRAKEIIKVAYSCQVGNVAFPLSLLNLWTSSSWKPSERERALRFRAEQLSHQKQVGKNLEEAIIEITQMLHEEGLNEELVTEDIDREIIDSIRAALLELCPDRPPLALNALMWYHLLLLRTGGRDRWTLRRACGETLVKPYHPLLLEGLQEQVVVTVSLEGNDAQNFPTLDQPPATVMAGFAWREISILKFLHGLEKFDDPASQTTVAIIANQENDISFKESSERDEERDEIFVNSIGESYIVGNGDLRKLYANRPAAVQSMTLAQFVLSYYKKQSYQQVVINPESGVGDDSEELIVGSELRAPLSIQLSNSVVMKKRTGKSKPVPLFLPGNSLDNFGARLLFLPWRSSEELHQRLSEEERAKIKQNRLQLFPMAEFPRVAYDE